MTMASPHTSQQCLFSALPLELLTRIYVDTGNAFFPLACKHLYSSFSSEYTRLTFCANIWDPSYCWGQEYPDLSKAQTAVLVQNWFTPSFAQRVEEEITKRIASKNPTTRTIPRSIPGARLPSYCLRPPWTEEKTELLNKCLKWNVRAHWTREKRSYPGLLEAIEGGWIAVIQAYTHPAINCEVEEAIVLKAIQENVPRDALVRLIRQHFGTGRIKGMTETEVYKTIERRAALERENDWLKLAGEGEDQKSIIVSDGSFDSRSKWRRLEVLLRKIESGRNYSSQYDYTGGV